MPSIFNDGFTLKIISQWDADLAQLIFDSWVKHRNLEGSSYVNNENVFRIVSSNFQITKIKQVTESYPSIIFSLPKIIELIKDDSNKQGVYLKFAEDILFNLVMKTPKKLEGNLF